MRIMASQSNTITDRFNQVINIIGLPPHMIAKEMNCDTRALKRVLNGQTEPVHKMLFTLATKYDVSANWLIKGTGAIFTKSSNLNNPALSLLNDVQEIQSIRYAASIEVLACLDLWLFAAREECYKKMKSGPSEFINARNKLVKKNMGLIVSLNAQLIINRTKYTINNSMNLLP